jgi:hypothetical protein
MANRQKLAKNKNRPASPKKTSPSRLSLEGRLGKLNGLF